MDISRKSFQGEGCNEASERHKYLVCVYQQNEANMLDYIKFYHYSQTDSTAQKHKH
jgi:hypothetical protein